MKTIKKLKKGNFVLTHSRYVDFGEHDALELFDTKKRVRMPFIGMMKATNFKISDPIKLTTDYTLKEYKQMFEEQIKIYKSNK